VTLQERINGFARWFSYINKMLVLGYEASWVKPYVRAAYNKGTHDAAIKINKEAIYNDERREAFANLAVVELTGLTNELERRVVQQTGRVITLGGTSRQILSSIYDRLRVIGQLRARAYVNTTVVAAHANGSLEMCGAAGLTHVGVKAEFVKAPKPIVGFGDARRRRIQETLVGIVTAGDDLVCEDCLDLEANNPYRLQEALGLIPAHVNCRCAWEPWSNGGEGEEE
jgi:hypothetical protein